MSARSDMPTLAVALSVLARDVQSDDGLANAALYEASDRMAQLYADLQVVAPLLSRAAATMTQRRSAAGKDLRDAANRLIAEVIA